MTRRTRLLLVAGGVLSAWFVLVLALWAFHPLTDSVPVGLNADKVPVSQEVKCNTLFESRSHSGAAPVVVKPMKYEREPCVAVHREARIVFGIDAGLYALGMVLLAAIAVRGRRAQHVAIPVFG
jgi:hypothetical protein